MTTDRAREAAYCPKCSGAGVVETATVRPPVLRVDLVLRCGCGVTWAARDLEVGEALAITDVATTQSPWVGSSHAARGLLLEVTGHADAAYATYDRALRCPGAFDRAFCWERRGAHEAARGWLRNALRSLRRARSEDEHASGARQDVYRGAIAQVESAMQAQGIGFPAAHRDAGARWERECELELPAGLGARNEVGEPLADDVIEVERRVRAARWDDAVAAFADLRGRDAGRFVDAIGYASRGAGLARAAGRRDAAIALQRLVVEAFVIRASWSTSGAEGHGRTAEVQRERERLWAWERDAAARP